MPNQAAAIFGIAAIVLICYVAYVMGSPRLQQADVQSLYWGRMIAAAYPVLLTTFAVVFTVVLLKVSFEGGAKQLK